MLNIFTSQKVRSRMESGPMGPYLSAIAAELQQQGYARSTIRRHLRAADHFGAWLVKHGLSLKDISEPLVDRYLIHHAREVDRFIKHWAYRNW